MTVYQLYKHFDTVIPRSLSCEWDNDGLMCCPDASREVKKVLVALDATADVATEAIEGGYDAIITHHPFIFKGLKSITDGNFIGSKSIDLIRAGISVFSFHTRLDTVAGGVNDVLASVLGIKETTTFGEMEMGRIGTLDAPVSPEEFAKKVKDALGVPAVNLSACGKPCYRVAVLGGGGDSETGAAMAAGADTYVTGNLGFHTLTDAPDMGINLIEAGHFYTENPVCHRICEIVREADASIECHVTNSNRIQTII